MEFPDEMSSRLPIGMRLPEEFRALFRWIEEGDRFMVSDAYPGDRLGLLGTQDDLNSDGITAILFRVATPEQAREFGEAWFGSVVPAIEERLVPFARTGSDGSYAAFWLDDASELRVVHVGSEGLVCLLGETPLDFLRLIGVGYQEVSGDGLDGPSEPPDVAGRNAAYRSWVIDRFQVDLPRTAAEVLGPIPDVFAASSDDPFWQWVREKQDLRDASPS